MIGTWSGKKGAAVVEESNLRGIVSEESPRFCVLIDVGAKKRKAGKKTPKFCA